jgi:hypothetical protein
MAVGRLLEGGEEMDENRADHAVTIRRELDEFGELMSPALINALSEAAEDDDLWLEAARDTRGFLREKGVELPDWAEIRLEAVFPARRVMSQDDLPQCDPGYVLVATHGTPYCSRRVVVCRTYPHIGEVCFFRHCLKWEQNWLDARCVSAHFLRHQLRWGDPGPEVYNPPEG